MIFRVYEHYDDDQSIYLNSDIPDMCFICYEFKTELELETISLKSQDIYNKLCNCDGWIHKQCFLLWSRKKHTCPICRQKMFYKTTTLTIPATNMIYYPTRIYLFFCKMSYSLFYIFLAYSIIEFYISISMTKYLIRNN